MESDYGYQKRDLTLTTNLDVMKFLLNDGVDINDWGILGHTPIHQHANDGNLEVVKFLLSMGADPHKKNIYQDNDAISGAKYYGHDNIWKFLISNT